MKRVIAVVLALAMLLSMTAVAFANGFAASGEKKEIKAGETLEVAFKINEAITNVQTLETQLTFNGDLFTVDVDATEAATNADAVNGSSMNFRADNADKGADSYLRATAIATNKAGLSYKTGDVFAKLVVKAKETITETATAEFKAIVTSAAISTGAFVTDQFADTPVSFTVTVSPAQQEVDGYTVAAGFASGSKDTIVKGETTQVALTIGNKDIKTYNAFDLTVTYDTDVLEYVKAEGTDVTAKDNNGTLRITGYGKNKTCGTDNIVLIFTGKAIGKGDVTVKSAKVDEMGNAISKDAPEAKIITPAVTVNVGGYAVTLPTGFTADSLVATPGEDYTFKATDPNKKYDFTGSTMGGNDVTVINNGNGTYTISNVTGELKITATEIVQQANVKWTGDAVDDLFNPQVVKTDKWNAGKDMPIIIKAQLNDDGTLAKEYVLKVNGQAVTLPDVDGGKIRYTIPGATFKANETVTIDLSYKPATQMVTIEETGDGWDDVTNRTGWTKSGDQVKEGASDLAFMILPKNNRTYTVTANGTTITGIPMQGNVMYRYAIPAELVKGEKLTINVTYTEPGTSTTTINFTGSGAADVVGGTNQQAPNGKDFQFTINAEANYTYEVTLGDTTLEIGADGKYTIPGAQINGTALTVTVIKTPVPTVEYTVAVSQYVQLDGKTMWLVTATATNTSDVLTYGGDAMYWSDGYNAYAWLVISDKAQADVQTEALTKMGHSATAVKTTIDYSGDVNKSDIKDINDAQLVWNMYNAQYDDFTNVSMEKFLRADVNKDKSVNTDDAAAIIAIITQ